MVHTRWIEISVGAFVAAGFVALFMLAMQVSNLGSFSEDDGYRVSARFDNVGGLTVRSPVKMGGVRVGRVTGIDYDTQTYQAVVEMMIQSRFSSVPADTSASIMTAGLLGEQYVGLEPGGDIAYLKEGDEISLTQSALVLEQIVGQFLFQKASESEPEAK